MSVIAELERLIGRIDALIATLPERGVEYDYDRWNAWRAAEEAAFDTFLADEGGKSRQRGGDAIYLRMAGVSSSSTWGRAQVMRNWQWAARRRIAKLRKAEAEDAAAGLKATCDAFNARYPVGTPGLFTRDSGELFRTRTRSEAMVLSGHSAVVWLEGVGGYYLLDRFAPDTLNEDKEQGDE